MRKGDCMKVVPYQLEDLKRVVIPLGYAGENERMAIKFECGGLFAEYPGAVPALAVKPPRGEIYLGILVRDGDAVTWVLSASDLAYDGDGFIQLSFIQDGAVAKSYKGRTSIGESL